MTLSDILSMDNPVFGSYALYGTLSLCKMMGMAFMTGAKRIKTGVSIKLNV